MKYIAVFEIPDNEVGLLELTVSQGHGLPIRKIVEPKQAPKPRCNIHGITEEDFWERAGYDRALRDCGVI